DLIDVRVVALGLGHLQAIITKHDAVGDNLLECWAVKECGGQNVQQVEPATGLTDVLHDEVRWRVGIEPFFVLEWVMHLRKWHGARVEPYVQNVRNTANHGLTSWVIWVWTHQLVDVWTEQRLWTLAEVALQLIQGTVNIDAWVLVIIRHPHWDWGTPETRTGDVPVARAFEPLTELAIANMLWHPFDLIVVELNHAVTNSRNFHEPCWHCFVDQRLTGAPRVWVGVLNGDVADNPTLSFKVADDVLVSVKDQLAFILRSQRSELAVIIDRHNQFNAVLRGGCHIVFTEARCLVHNASTVLGGDIVSQQNLERIRLILEVIKDRLVGDSFKFSALESLDNLMVLA